jgi:FkbM family methyltransferase
MSRLLKDLASDCAAKVCAWLIWRLHNRNTPRWTRDEIRALRFGFSQCGEDQVLLGLFSDLGIERGTYVDVGAYDPVNISNTLLLHKQGWHGVNIDLNAVAIERFKQVRPDDTNLHAAISDHSQVVSVHQYRAAVLNRIASADEKDTKALGLFDPIATISMQTSTLRDLLARHPPPGDKIDYLNVDCEGHDLHVLQSMDWARWRPAVITVEALDAQSQEALERYLSNQGYELTNKMHLTLFFCPRAGAAPATREVGADAKS